MSSQIKTQISQTPLRDPAFSVIQVAPYYSLAKRIHNLELEVQQLLITHEQIKLNQERKHKQTHTKPFL